MAEKKAYMGMASLDKNNIESAYASGDITKAEYDELMKKREEMLAKKKGQASQRPKGIIDSIKDAIGGNKDKKADS